MSKPIILIIINHYLPGYKAGGPIRTTANMVYWLGDEFDFRILTTDTDLGIAEPYPDIQYGVFQSLGKAQIRYLSKDEQGFSALRHIINSIDYDIIYLDSVFATPSVYTSVLYRLNMIRRKPLILVPRGHLNEGAVSLKSYKKQPFLIFASLVDLYRGVLWHASNQTEADDILREIPNVDASDIHIISNLPTPIDTEKPITSDKQPNHLKVVFVSRVSPKKNLHYAIERFTGLDGDVQFDIYGPIESDTYWEKCQQAIDKLPSNVLVNYCGSLVSEEVVATISKYHLLFLPTLGENFGHVIFEAFRAGCPVLLSQHTPWAEVEYQNAGWICDLEHPEVFQERLQQAVELDSKAHLLMRQAAYEIGTAYLNNSDLINNLSKLFSTTIR